MKRRRKGRGGRVPGIPVPSTPKSRAASRLNPFRTGKYATVVSDDEACQQHLARIESGLLGTESDREEIRRLQREIQRSRRSEAYFEADALRFELREFVFSLRKVSRSKE